MHFSDCSNLTGDVNFGIRVVDERLIESSEPLELLKLSCDLFALNNAKTLCKRKNSLNTANLRAPIVEKTFKVGGRFVQCEPTESRRLKLE